MTAYGKRITVIGDSILKGIKGREMSNHVTHGRTYVKPFPGATCTQMMHYIVPTLTEDRPDAMVIHVGTNDVTRRRGQVEKSSQDVAKAIIDIGIECQKNGVNDIFISGITYRRGFHEMKKVHEINDLVRDFCTKENFHFICNASIREQHLWEDGLHLLDIGKNVLANNIINSLNANL